MANSEHVEILKLGVQAWNAWRSANPDISPDLTNYDFGVVDLIGINFENTWLSSSSLFCINLDKANLDGADLENSNCYAGSFNEVNFQSSQLRLANLTLASFDNANLLDARLGNTIFADCDLSTAKNLETCFHEFSSIVDYRTLAQSGNLPISFLRGCGVPEFIIDNISVLKDDPIIFLFLLYKLFIKRR